MIKMKENHTHKLKTWPIYYKMIISGLKKFELRKNDRNFQVGDKLILQEYHPGLKSYTGNEIHVKVDYILHGPQFGLMEGFCAMSIDVPEEKHTGQ